jgi:hypothetical protein
VTSLLSLGSRPMEVSMVRWPFNADLSIALQVNLNLYFVNELRELKVRLVKTRQKQNYIIRLTAVSSRAALLLPLWPRTCPSPSWSWFMLRRLVSTLLEYTVYCYLT